MPVLAPTCLLRTVCAFVCRAQAWSTGGYWLSGLRCNLLASGRDKRAGGELLHPWEAWWAIPSGWPCWPLPVLLAIPVVLGEGRGGNFLEKYSSLANRGGRRFWGPWWRRVRQITTLNTGVHSGLDSWFMFLSATLPNLWGQSYRANTTDDK